MRKYWYFITTHSCPVCGGEKHYRERRYGKKPKQWDKRHRLDFNAYDYCLEMGWS
jgi:hypothetical protein